jgi:hypothetical protein
MARKLRFFKEQMVKAGITPLTKPGAQTEIDVDDLEVCYKVEYTARNALDGSGLILFCMVLGAIGKTWGTRGRAG